MTHTQTQLLNFLKRASYGKSKLFFLGTSQPCMLTEKNRRLNGDHEPHSNGHIHLVIAGGLDQNAQHHLWCLVLSNLVCSPHSQKKTSRLAVRRRQWRVRSALLRRLADRRLSSENSGWAAGPCVTSQRLREAVLRLIASPTGAPAHCRQGRSSYQPFSLVTIPCGLVVCTANVFLKNESPQVELSNTTSSLKGSTKSDIKAEARTAPSSVWGGNLSSS
jgi:hypothetical protein